MINSVEVYLSQLMQALRGCDPATLHDALADAEEHLRSAMAGDPAADLSGIIEAYGTPEEVASAYREIEKRLPPVLAPETHRPGTAVASPIGRFFGVLVDPRAWGALLYLLISLLTGILYFTWGVTGVSLSLGLIVLIIGIPFFALFMLSVRGIGLVEGRIVEALLGVRMPRRPIFVDTRKGWWERFKDLLASWTTWKTLLYLVAQLPLGVIYFTILITLLALGLGLFAAPLVQVIIKVPIIMLDSVRYYLPWWGMLLACAGGILVVTLTMHLAKGLGFLHGRFARWMLVSQY